MRPAAKFVLALACVSFLTITLTGFHAHADVHGEHESHGVAHFHVPPPEFDEDHIDISIFEPATCFSKKAESVALNSALPELTFVSRAETLRSERKLEQPTQRHVRWRPELRGPPISH